MQRICSNRRCAVFHPDIHVVSRYKYPFGRCLSLKSMPAPIRGTIIKTLLCIFAVMAFGIIWGIASHDRILLALSACVAVFGALKVLPLISSVKKGQYQELLCTVLSDKKSSLLNRHQLTVYTDDQEEKTIMLSGRAALKSGKRYRIFLAGQEDDALNAVPDYLRPGRSLLGSEELEEQ